MSKYIKKIVFDYVCGNDIDDYDIDALEDDYKFMIMVIDYTNDKNMYNMCSNRVKNTYEFVKFMINKFSNDLDFICNIANDYLDKTSNEFNRLELLIIMSSLVDKDNQYFLKYKLSLEASYLVKKINITAIKQHPEAADILDIIQAGFWIIFDKYNSSYIIMKYFTKRFIDDLIDEFGINLEEKIHKEFKSFQELEDSGINNYLLNLLSGYDSNLSAYIGCHLDLLDDMKKYMNRIKHRWDFYILSMESKKYHAMIEKVHEYIIEHKLEYSLVEEEILYYIGRELGIAEKIANYEGIDNEFYEDIMSTLDEYNSISFAKAMNELEFFKHYHNIKKLMISILTSGDTSESIITTKDSLEQKTRILRFIPKVND